MASAFASVKSLKLSALGMAALPPIRGRWIEIPCMSDYIHGLGKVSES